MSDPLDDMLGALGGDQPAPQDTPAPEPQPDPTPKPPSADPMDDLMAGFGAEPEPEPQPDPPTPEPDPDEASPAPEADDFDALFDSVVPEKPDWLKGEKELKGWADHRRALKETEAARAALEMELAELRSSGSSASQDAPQPLPESEAVQKLQQELEALKPAAEKWQAEEARRELRHTRSYQEQFERPRLGILRELNATAQKIGLNEQQVEDFLRQGSEYDQQQWLEENIEDPVAQRIFTAKGSTFLDISKQAEQVQDAPDPIRQLKEFQEAEDAMAHDYAIKLSEGITRQLKSAAVAFRDASKSDPFFASTQLGQQTLHEIDQRLADSNGFTPEEIIAGVAAIKKADAMQAMLIKARGEIAKLKEAASKQKQLDPGARLLQGGGGGSNGSQSAPSNDVLAGFDDAGIGGAPKPLISKDALAGSRRL